MLPATTGPSPNPPRQRRCWRAQLSAVAVSASLMLAGCGDDRSSKADDPAPEAEEESGFPTPEGSWLIAGGVVASESDEWSEHLIFISFNPETGETHYINTVENAAAMDDDEVLTVSADYQLALPTTDASDEEAASGVVNIYHLADGNPDPFDFRSATGDVAFKPSQFAFDPEDPDALHVIGEDRSVWKINVADETGEKQSATGDTFYPASTEVASGDVSTEDTGVRPGGSNLDDTPNSPDLPELPDGHDAAFQTDDGKVWAFAVEGEDCTYVEDCDSPRTLRVYTMPSNSANGWERLETQPSEPIPPGLDIRWVRPPLD